MLSTILLPLLLQFTLIAINGIFACTEIAVISLNQELVKAKADEGDKSAMRLVKLMQRPGKFLATIQVGITFAGFLASAFAASTFAQPLANWLRGIGVTITASTLETICIIVITLILSYFTLVFGELVPKRIALKRAESIARTFGGLVYYISKITAPIVWLLTVSTNAILRLLGIDPHDNSTDVTEEEIRILVDQGEEKGTIEPYEGEMIDNIFELNDIKVSEIMTPRTSLIVLWKDDNIDVWKEQICKVGFSRYPVCGEDKDDVIGILHVQDLLCRDIVELEFQKVHFVQGFTKAYDVLLDMLLNKSHMYIVTDEYGGVSGIVTLEDIIEEIVGDIEDEHDIAAITTQQDAK